MRRKSDLSDRWLAAQSRLYISLFLILQASACLSLTHNSAHENDATGTFPRELLMRGRFYCSRSSLGTGAEFSLMHISETPRATTSAKIVSAEHAVWLVAAGCARDFRDGANFTRSGKARRTIRQFELLTDTPLRLVGVVLLSTKKPLEQHTETENVHRF